MKLYEFGIETDEGKLVHSTELPRHQQEFLTAIAERPNLLRETPDYPGGYWAYEIGRQTLEDNLVEIFRASADLASAAYAFDKTYRLVDWRSETPQHLVGIAQAYHGIIRTDDARILNPEMRRWIDGCYQLNQNPLPKLRESGKQWEWETEIK
jgi:hypothetical protein